MAEIGVVDKSMKASSLAKMSVLLEKKKAIEKILSSSTDENIGSEELVKNSQREVEVMKHESYKHHCSNKGRQLCAMI